MEAVLQNDIKTLVKPHLFFFLESLL